MDGRESDWGWPYSHLKVDQRNQLALELDPRHQAFHSLSGSPRRKAFMPFLSRCIMFQNTLPSS